MIGYQSAPRTPSRRITIYSHKGGVGKTTLTVHLAYALAALGKRVLLIDADPQCSLSSYFVSADALDSYLDDSEKKSGQTLWSALRPVITHPQNTPNLVQCVETAKKLLVLLGDIRVSEFEDALNAFWKDGIERRSSGLTGINAISWLINGLSERYKADFVFYDCGPNIGPLNRVVFLDCDFLIVPAACDEFSIRAITTLGQTIKKWLAGWQRIEDLAPEGTYLLPGSPKLLGYIVQQFKTYAQKITGGYKAYADKIDKSILSDIRPVLRSDPVPTGGYELAEIPSFSFIANASQSEGVPMWEVKDGDPNVKATAQKRFMELAEKVVRQTGS